MKRQIKYRQAHYFDEGLTKFSHFTYWGFGLDGEVFRSPSSNNYAQYSIHDQFTGLTDKNGVEIYEGDLLKIGVLTYRVVFHNFGWKLIKGNIRLDIIDLFGGLEVIGNLHENPELL